MKWLIRIGCRLGIHWSGTTLKSSGWLGSLNYCRHCNACEYGLFVVRKTKGD